MALNNTLEQVNLIGICRIFLLKAVEYTVFFKCTWRTFFTIDHMLGHKTRLNKFKKIEFIPSIFSDHNGMNLEMNYKKKAEKN